MKYVLISNIFKQGVEFRNPEKALGGWLPLEAYDDRDLDSKKPIEWLRKSKTDPTSSGAGAQGLWRDKDGLCYWRRVKILKYLPKSERFEGYWENTKERCRLFRIFLLFDDEDPRMFAKRFKKAYSNRIYADSIIRYNYYIENMPTHQIPEIDND